MQTMATDLLLVMTFLFLSMVVSVHAGMTVKNATLAGGCFWCMQPVFQKLEGVIEVVSGYTGGSGSDPTYEDYGQKGHVEAIQITYNPSVVNFEQILEVFWRHIDPTDGGGQFVDRGPHYRSVIFYHTEEERRVAELSKQRLSDSGRFRRPIATEILPASKFYRAEEYHQDYDSKQPLKYMFYRQHSGRDQYLEKIWKGTAVKKGWRQGYANRGKKDRDELKKRLTPLQWEVTQENGTEPPFQNEYWDNKREGIYVDVVSGEPLFSSTDKFDSGTGWPSFTRPLESEMIVERKDRSLFGTRVEVRSKEADSHLGHVFTDGPRPTALRYCINSAALRFIPKDDLEKEGYAGYKKLFGN